MTSIASINAVTTPTTPTTPADTPADTPIADASSKRQSFSAEMFHALSLSGAAAQDAATLIGVDTTSGDGPTVKPVSLLTVAGVNAGAAAIITANRASALNMTKGQYVGEFSTQAGTNLLRVTPTLVSAIAGPAVADGITYVAPNLIPKYKKEMNESQKSQVRIGRAVAGGAAVGVAAAVAFLVKPDLFKSVGFISEAARSGTIMRNGEVIEQLAPMARDAVFSNRMLIGLAGAGATLVLANHAAGESDPAKQKLWWGATAGAAALTGAGVLAAGKLTRGAETASKLAFLPGDGAGVALFHKPNKQWVMDFAKKIAPLTAVPAGTAASQYYNIVSDFETITKPNSPFRK